MSKDQATKQEGALQQTLSKMGQQSDFQMKEFQSSLIEQKSRSADLQRAAITDLSKQFIKSRVDSDQATDDIERAAIEFQALMQHAMGVTTPVWLTPDWCIQNYGRGK